MIPLIIVAAIHPPHVPTRVPHPRNINILHDLDTRGQTSHEERTQVQPEPPVLYDVSGVPQSLDKVTPVENPVRNQGKGVVIRVRLVESDGVAVFCDDRYQKGSENGVFGEEDGWKDIVLAMEWCG